MNRILIVDDDPALLHLLKSVLDYGGFAYEGASTAQQALKLFAAGTFDAVLLDLKLPDLHGSELITFIRARSDLPILVISGDPSEQQRIEALDLGADDFVPKPFLPGELLARIRAAIRRSGTVRDTHKVAFDPREPHVDVDGRRVPLSKLEQRMLAVLAESEGGVATKEALCEALWGAYSPSAVKTLYVVANRLRNKLEVDPHHPEHLVSEHGVGYRLVLK
jgi:two-component system KDP operon response regulator KdpE